jgi:hypothetical protein
LRQDRHPVRITELLDQVSLIGGLQGGNYRRSAYQVIALEGRAKLGQDVIKHKGIHGNTSGSSISGGGNSEEENLPAGELGYLIGS